MKITDRSRWIALLFVVLGVACVSGDTAEQTDESAAGTPEPEVVAPETPSTPPAIRQAFELPAERLVLLEPPLSLPPETCVPPPDAPDVTPVPIEAPEGTPQEVVRHIVSLERELVEASPEQIPVVLYRLGVIKSELGISRGSPILAFGLMRSDFGIDEISGEFRYNGIDLRRLIETFPEHTLADDSAYRIAHFPDFGECEGWIACDISRDWYKVAGFVRSLPESDFAAGEVRRAIKAFEQVPDDTDLRVSREYHSPGGFRALVSSLDSVAGDVSQTLGGPLLERAAEIWTQFAEFERARSSLATLLATREDADVAQCILERARMLPTDWVRQELVEVSDSLGATLTWAAIEEVADSVLVYRSSSADDIGEVVGRPAPSATTWSDQSFSGEAVQWYRIVAYTPTGAVGSNPSAAGVGR